MKRSNKLGQSLMAWLACALFLSVLTGAAHAKEINGYYLADDGGTYYIRQLGTKVYWFGEDENGAFANVLAGTISGNKITARWWDVPKGKAQGAGEISLEIRGDGETLVKLSAGGFGAKSWKKGAITTSTVGGIPVPTGFQPIVKSRGAGFLGGEKNLTAAWDANDYAVYYVREMPNGEVVWVAEHRFYDYAQPAFTHVFIGKKTGTTITGEWIDVPKGKTAGNGTLTLEVKDPQELVSKAKTGGFFASTWQRSLPNSLRGFADLHAHPMVNLAFGGKLVHGGPDVGSLLPADSKCQPKVRAKSMEHALGTDNSTHGGHGAFDNTCGDDIRKAVIDSLQEAKKAVVTPDWAKGAPGFQDYPKWNDITHQKMWIDWVRRAYDGGQRVMVALATHNQTFAAALSGPGDGPTDDKGSADLQIDEIKAFVGRHNDFMEVAYSPTDLRRIVASNKMAIVLGLEIDNLGGFDKLPGVNAAIVNAELQRLHNKGVRYVFPVHVIDNKFGGTAVYEDAFNLSNYRESGNFWDIECGKPTDKINYFYKPGGFDAAVMAVKAIKLGVDIARNPPTPPTCKGLGHRNKRGLTPLGEAAIRGLMKLGMLIDIDHMSQHTVDATLKIVEAFPNGGYPVVSGHTSLRGNGGNENSRTPEQLARIGKLGGMFGLGSDQVGAQEFLKDYLTASNQIGAGRVSLGTDLNGLVKGPQPRKGADIYNAVFPLSRSADKKWDYRTEGVAHYGMMADFLRDIFSLPNGTQVEDQIMKNAEFFAQMWEKAVAQSKVPQA